MTTRPTAFRGHLSSFAFPILLSAILGASPAYCAETQSHVDAEGPNCAQVAVHRSLMLLGIPVNMDVIALRMPSGPNGNTLLELRDVLECIGVKSKGYRTTLEELQKGPFPVIVHYREHFVVVAKSLPGFLYVYDGAGGDQDSWASTEGFSDSVFLLSRSYARGDIGDLSHYVRSRVQALQK